ncbi:MAG: protoglobin domain-containing protein [Sideroxyarcus sp.]
MNNEQRHLDGYDYGAPGVGRSPVTMEELALLERTVSLTAEDERWLQQAGSKLADQTDAIVAAWREVIAANPHLARYYASQEGVADPAYKAKVGARFKQWILDVCQRPRDQAWLDYQHEIGLRHTHLRKNRADQAAALPHIPLRYLIAFTAVINDRIRPFLAKDAAPDAAAAMYSAWCKAVLLQVTLWSRPYVAESEW